MKRFAKETEKKKKKEEYKAIIDERKRDGSFQNL